MFFRLAVAIWCPLALALPRGADACTCLPEREPCEAYWQASAIFRGRVASIEYEPGKLPPMMRASTVTFTVLEAFRGVDGPTVAVWTAARGGTCGYRFRTGREYVVYAEHHRGRLTTSICTRTREAGRAEGDLAYARAIAAGTPVRGRVSGEVRMVVTDPSTGRSRERPMPGVEVTLRGEATERSGRTDRGGRFEFLDLPTGRYVPSVAVPPGLRPEPLPAEVSLPDIRACASILISVVPEGRVTGRVITARGSPARGVTVELLVPRAGGGLASAAGLRAATDRAGRYAILGVPPGRFVAAIDLSDGSGNARRILDPGVHERSAARSFAMDPGAAVDLGDLPMPADVALVEVSGLVVDGERAPVEGARVYARGTTDRTRILSAPIPTDFAGGFTISMLAGGELELFAERQSGTDPADLDASEPVRVLGTVGAGPVILTLRKIF